MTRICTWREYGNALGGTRWDLVVRRGGTDVLVARVRDSGAWYTFDRHGFGSEINVEKDVRTAKAMAAASAIEQGFI